MKQVSLEVLREEPDVTILHLSGEIGLDLVPQITAVLEEHRQKGASHWAVDLSRVDFLSSPAVGVIMGLRSRVIHMHGSVSLFSASRELSEKLQLMGVDLAIPSYLDKSDFLNHFRWEFKGASRSVRLTLPAEIRAVPPTRRLIAGLLESKGYGHKDAFVMETIVDELSNNAIEHGRPSDGIFEVKLDFDRREARLSVSNRSDALSGEEKSRLVQSYEHPRVDPGSLRGRGIALVKKLSSRVNCRVDGEKVEVEIVRKREKP